jgi:hypothetical protein
MHIPQTHLLRSASEGDSTFIVLREARRLHKLAAAASLAASLPVLRRLIESQSLTGLTLPELHRQRGIVQRKHVLRTLAVEAGHPSWEAYRVALASLSPQSLEHYDLARRAAGYPNLWFSTPEQAQGHARVHGGRVLQVGKQAVVFPAEAVAA